MASVSVVGQQPAPHRLDSEPPLLFIKLTGARKKMIPLPRKTSWERMMFRRSSGSSGESGVAAAETDSASHPSSPAPAVESAAMPEEGCVARLAPAAPRSPERDAGTGCADCDSRTRESGAGIIAGDCNSNTDSDLNRNTGGRRGKTDTSVMQSRTVTNGHKRAQRPRDAPRGRRSTWSADSRHQGISSPSSVPARGESGGPPLERVTHSKSGVVRLARTEPPRREAWSIFTCGMDPRMKAETGEGHRFEAKPVTQDWCDACSRQITAQALKCQNCSYTCHLECERRVQLDCNQRDKEPKRTTSPRGQRSSSLSSSSSSSSATPLHKQNEAKEEEAGGVKKLSEEEVRTRIEEYNAQDSENKMNMNSDGSYTGFIKVHLRLSRPITVPNVVAPGSEELKRLMGGSGQAPPEGQEAPDFQSGDKRTSFYLPSACMKQIHISSHTTTREVIQGLLKKFMVLDNPRKFALYRQTHRDGQDLFQKLPLCEHPLLLRLIAGPDPEQLSFVLKENETGEVEWHAFSVPELQNFLVILEKEEGERVRAVEQKYNVYRQKLQQALKQYDP